MVSHPIKRNGFGNKTLPGPQKRDDADHQDFLENLKFIVSIGSIFAILFGFFLESLFLGYFDIKYSAFAGISDHLDAALKYGVWAIGVFAAFVSLSLAIFIVITPISIIFIISIIVFIYFMFTPYFSFALSQKILSKFISDSEKESKTNSEKQPNSSRIIAALNQYKKLIKTYENYGYYLRISAPTFIKNKIINSYILLRNFLRKTGSYILLHPKRTFIGVYIFVIASSGVLISWDSGIRKQCLKGVDEKTKIHCFDKRNGLASYLQFDVFPKFLPVISRALVSFDAPFGRLLQQVPGHAQVPVVSSNLC